jgi:hypothetical protein
MEDRKNDSKMKFCRDCGISLEGEWACSKCGLDQRILDAVPRHPYQQCVCGEDVLVNRKYCQICGALNPEPLPKPPQEPLKDFEKKYFEQGKHLLDMKQSNAGEDRLLSKLSKLADK